MRAGEQQHTVQYDVCIGGVGNVGRGRRPGTKCEPIQPTRRRTRGPLARGPGQTSGGGHRKSTRGSQCLRNTIESAGQWCRPKIIACTQRNRVLLYETMEHRNQWPVSTRLRRQQGHTRRVCKETTTHGTGERSKDSWRGEVQGPKMIRYGIASRAEGSPHVCRTRASAGVTRALDLPGTGSVTDAVSKESSSPGWCGPVGEAGSAGSDRADAEGILSLVQQESRSSRTAQGPGNEGWYMRDSGTHTSTN